jgi:hypothetical protein
MGWVKTPIRTSEDIFKEITSQNPKWKGRKGSSSPYEYWSDYIKDYYDVTLHQCDEICKMLMDFYKIKKFYAS